MAGAAPSIEAAMEMDEVMRAAAIIVAMEIEESRRAQMVRAFGAALGGNP